MNLKSKTTVILVGMLAIWLTSVGGAVCDTQCYLDWWWMGTPAGTWNQCVGTTVESHILFDSYIWDDQLGFLEDSPWQLTFSGLQPSRLEDMGKLYIGGGQYTDDNQYYAYWDNLQVGKYTSELTITNSCGATPITAEFDILVKPTPPNLSS